MVSNILKVDNHPLKLQTSDSETVKGWAAVLVAGGCAGTGDPAPQVIFSEVIQDHKANRGLAPHTATL